jgi:hypothetical protein
MAVVIQGRLVYPGSTIDDLRAWPWRLNWTTPLHRQKNRPDSRIPVQGVSSESYDDAHHSTTFWARRALRRRSTAPSRAAAHSPGSKDGSRGREALFRPVRGHVAGPFLTRTLETGQNLASPPGTLYKLRIFESRKTKLVEGVGGKKKKRRKRKRGGGKLTSDVPPSRSSCKQPTPSRS